MHSMSLSYDCDVLVVGAGPVGLTLASELTRHGVSCRIIDKAQEVAPWSRAAGIQARTLELFEKMGLADTFLARGNKAKGFSVLSQEKQLAHFDFTRLIDSPYPYAFLIPQHITETILAEHLTNQQGIPIECGMELIDLAQQEHGVEAVLRRSDGSETRVHTRWLVGCDGAHSRVRHLMGMGFGGTAFEQHFALGDMEVAWERPNDRVVGFVGRGSLIAFFPLGGGRFRVIATYRPHPGAPGEEVTLQDVEHVMEACGLHGVRVSHPVGLQGFHIHQRKVKQYGQGRVFLAGDAAHIHSPLAAQGMNTGIQDAFNLAWKLALVASKQAPASLLASYQAEREPVGRVLLQGTELLTRLAVLRAPLLVTLRNMLIPRITSLSAVQHLFANTLAMLRVSYRHSPIVRDVGGQRGKLRAGDRAPDGLVQAGPERAAMRLFEGLRGTRHVLLVFAGQHDARTIQQRWREIDELLSCGYRELVEAYFILVRTDQQSEEENASVLYDPEYLLHQRYGMAQEGLVLIRPDGYIGFRSQSLAVEPLQVYCKKLFLPLEVPVGERQVAT
ncbi:MAG: FAD-binding protein [Chloroflexi bacterium]|nr:MAG: FAD-binding protein [Chloroflexota bacterium]